MKMSKDEKRNYLRGYSRGYQKRAEQWPEHKPPLPPNPLVAGLMTALRELRDECDNICATIEPDDEFAIRLNPKIDKADEALRVISAWLRTPEEQNP